MNVECVFFGVGFDILTVLRGILDASIESCEEKETPNRSKKGEKG